MVVATPYAPTRFGLAPLRSMGAFASNNCCAVILRRLADAASMSFGHASSGILPRYFHRRTVSGFSSMASAMAEMLFQIEKMSLRSCMRTVIYRINNPCNCG